MPESLELTIDKFTFRVPTDRRYAAEGLWLQIEPTGPAGRVRIGVTDFLQQRSGDAAFVDVRPAGTVLAAGEILVALETIKVTLEIPTPVAGTVVAINEALDLEPERFNQDPHGSGWLAVLDVPEAARHLAALLTPEAYLEVVRTEAMVAQEEP
jgi:glycine cleavage system H protein